MNFCARGLWQPGTQIRPLATTTMSIVNHDGAFSDAVVSALASAAGTTASATLVDDFRAALAPYGGFAFQIPECGGMGLCNPATAFLLTCGVSDLVVYDTSPRTLRRRKMSEC